MYPISMFCYNNDIMIVLFSLKSLYGIYVIKRLLEMYYVKRETRCLALKYAH